jgi:hypothetical protein
MSLPIAEIEAPSKPENASVDVGSRQSVDGAE